VTDGNLPSPDPALGQFVRRVALALLLAGLALALWRLAALAIILFGAMLMAIGLRAATRAIGKVARIGDAASLVLAIVGATALVGLAFWLFGSIIAGQIDELKRLVPTGLDLSAKLIETNRLARHAFEQARELDVAGVTGRAALLLAGLVRSLATAVGYVAIMLIGAVYLAAQPALYRRLLTQAVPPAYRPRANLLFDRCELLLRRWLVGQSVVMVAVGLLSGIGLWLLGVDAALALGLLSGLMSFVPYVGAALSAVPAILVALNQGPIYVLWVALLYVGVHVIEGYVVSPLVQAEATALPPVVSLVSIIFFGVLFGPAAVLLAAPLTLFLSVVLQTLYIEPMNGPGEPR
jgi:predicted PurR-regulated permease PerM